MSAFRVRRSPVTVKSLFIVNSSRPWFEIADSSEFAAVGLLGARAWLVSCGCVLPDNAQHNRQISMPPVGSFTGYIERWLKEAQEVELCEDEPGGMSPLLETLEDR